MRPRYLQIAMFAATAFPVTTNGQTANQCVIGYTVCSPPNATATTTPEIGSLDFRSLFVDIILSSLPSSQRDRLFVTDPSILSLCCTSTLSCLTMAKLGIPFCYDKFTTNYFLPDGSYGTVVGGAYTSSGGDIANLEAGFYTLVNGQTGNIYAEYETDKPNTTTLPMPSQFTASGVGTAIQASALGVEVTITYTTTLPASTVLGKTIPPSTVLPTVAEETILVPSMAESYLSNSVVLVTAGVQSVLPLIVPGTTMQGTTILGTTAGAIITTVTSTATATEVSGTSSSTTSVSALKSKDAAAGRAAPRHFYINIMISIYIAFLQ